MTYKTATASPQGDEDLTAIHDEVIAALGYCLALPELFLSLAEQGNG